MNKTSRIPNNVPDIAGIMRGIQPPAEVLLFFKCLDASEISSNDIGISRDDTNVGKLFGTKYSLPTIVDFALKWLPNCSAEGYLIASIPDFSFQSISLHRCFESLHAKISSHFWISF